ncbi:MAG: hypothetical protein KDC99_10620 [Cyclobacteriaceae bacterium]|nr:hypothetical protein [Cyclobacteriaceae bacterium]
MARVRPEIIEVIRKTADKIRKSGDYQWGHMGACNCGFLAQEITSLSKREIHSFAMEGHGDWNEQLNDYCPTSGLKMDDLISDLLNFGFDIDDLKHLERLSDPKVLRQLPINKRNLKQNNKADVETYLTAMARMLEERLANKVNLVELLEPHSALS